MTKTIGIYVYDEVEVLDFAGPFEVFCTASRVWARRHPEAEPLFRVLTVGRTAAPVRARGGLTVTPAAAMGDHPRLDVLVIPGGVVTAELERPDALAWIGRSAAGAEIVASVCTGVFLLAKAGVIVDGPVTTHWEDIPDLRAAFPALEARENIRWVDRGRVVTSAGISAGIDMSLHLVTRLTERESPGWSLGAATARQMEFEWRGGSGE